jgi:hypothetical protein
MCNGVGEAPKLDHCGESSTRRGGSPVGRTPGSIWPHALSPLAAALMGSWDLCLGEDSAVVNLLLVFRNWCSSISTGVSNSMCTSLCSLQAAIIDNSDIPKN